MRDERRLEEDRGAPRKRIAEASTGDGGPFMARVELTYFDRSRRVSTMAGP
jgi:hypothetical protein